MFAETVIVIVMLSILLAVICVPIAVISRQTGQATEIGGRLERLFNLSQDRFDTIERSVLRAREQPVAVERFGEILSKELRNKSINLNVNEEKLAKSIGNKLRDAVPVMNPETLADSISGKLRESMPPEALNEKRLAEAITDRLRESTLSESAVLAETIDAKIRSALPPQVSESVLADAVSTKVWDAMEAARVKELAVAESLTTKLHDTLEAMKLNESSLADSVSSKLRDTVPRMVESAVTDSLGSKLRDTVPRMVESAVTDSLGSKLCDAAPKVNESKLADSLSAKLRDAMPSLDESKLADSLNRKLRDTLVAAKVDESALADSLSSRLRDAMPRLDESSLADSLSSKLRDTMPKLNESALASSLNNKIRDTLAANESALADSLSSRLRDAMPQLDESALADSLSAKLRKTMPRLDETVLADSLNDRIRDTLSAAKVSESVLADSVSAKLRNTMPRLDESVLADSLNNKIRDTLSAAKVNESALAESVSSKLRDTMPRLDETALADSLSKKLRDTLGAPKVNESVLADSLSTRLRDKLRAINTMLDPKPEKVDYSRITRDVESKVGTLIEKERSNVLDALKSEMFNVAKGLQTPIANSINDKLASKLRDITDDLRTNVSESVVDKVSAEMATIVKRTDDSLGEMKRSVRSITIPSVDYDLLGGTVSKSLVNDDAIATLCRNIRSTKEYIEKAVDGVRTNVLATTALLEQPKVDHGALAREIVSSLNGEVKSALTEAVKSIGPPKVDHALLSDALKDGVQDGMQKLNAETDAALKAIASKVTRTMDGIKQPRVDQELLVDSMKSVLKTELTNLQTQANVAINTMKSSVASIEQPRVDHKLVSDTVSKSLKAELDKMRTETSEVMGEMKRSVSDAATTLRLTKFDYAPIVNGLTDILGKEIEKSGQFLKEAIETTKCPTIDTESMYERIAQMLREEITKTMLNKLIENMKTAIAESIKATPPKVNYNLIVKKMSEFVEEEIVAKLPTKEHIETTVRSVLDQRFANTDPKGSLAKLLDEEKLVGVLRTALRSEQLVDHRELAKQLLTMINASVNLKSVIESVHKAAKDFGSGEVAKQISDSLRESLASDKIAELVREEMKTTIATLPTPEPIDVASLAERVSNSIVSDDEFQSAIKYALTNAQSPDVVKVAEVTDKTAQAAVDPLTRSEHQIATIKEFTRRVSAFIRAYFDNSNAKIYSHIAAQFRKDFDSKMGPVLSKFAEAQKNQIAFVNTNMERVAKKLKEELVSAIAENTLAQLKSALASPVRSNEDEQATAISERVRKEQTAAITGAVHETVGSTVKETTARLQENNQTLELAKQITSMVKEKIDATYGTREWMEKLSTHFYDKLRKAIRVDADAMMDLLAINLKSKLNNDSQPPPDNLMKMPSIIVVDKKSRKRPATGCDVGDDTCHDETSPAEKRICSAIDDLAERRSNLLNIARARRSIAQVPNPVRLRQYTMMVFENKIIIGIYIKWDEESEVLGSMCNLLKEGIQYSYHNPDSPDTPHYMAAVEDFILKYRDALSRHKQLTGIPWGRNWYEFSVSSTCMLAYYLLMPTGSCKSIAASLILRIIDNPGKSLGYNRDGVNSIYLVGPWLLAHYYNNTIEKAIEHPEYKKVLSLTDTRFVYSRKADGLHRDFSFMAHNCILAPKYYLSLATDLTNYYLRMDPRASDSTFCYCDAIRKYLQHPSIARTLTGLNGRLRTFESDTYPDSPYGIRVMPLGKLLRYFTPTTSFIVKGQSADVGFFEADKSVDDTAHHWVQYRGVHRATSKLEFSWPEPGFITIRDNAPRLISRSDTTHIYYPEMARSMVMAYKHWGVLYQRYKISEFGDYTVDEFIVCNSATKTIQINIKIENHSSTESYIYYDVSNLPWQIHPKTNLMVESAIDLETGRTQMAKVNKGPEFPFKLDENNSIVLVDDNSCAWMHENSLKVLSQFECEYERDTIMVEYNKNLFAFTFNSLMNQYMIHSRTQE